MLIIISYPEFFQEEINAVNTLFDCGLEYFHLRKPDAGIDEISEYIENIPEKYRERIRVHSNYELIDKYGIGGAHLKTSDSPINTKYSLSVSCHSFNEIDSLNNNFEYYFLSPVFDSISKKGYKSAFETSELKRGLVNRANKKIIALGGINDVNIEIIKGLSFSGAAILGYIWEEFVQDKNLNNLIKRYEKISDK